ncbi:MAG: class I poly(R)-hydroxyalkanoic acid synthase [Ectothiorhodospiraceae bacterium]|nr:class I poly(R)-hydroxyalkanoic acid synthase [Chromatiales bacterium]MCP5154675.1 class I poly(R)-hydroxyalkanoic acid synthase [Ectothiorhodospiraceae bacterium]
MSDAESNAPRLPTAADLMATSNLLARHGMRMLTAPIAGNGKGNGNGKGVQVDDPLGLGDALMKLSATLMSNPLHLAQAQTRLWLDYAALARSAATRLMGGEAPPVVEPHHEDRRWRHTDWRENTWFDLIKQAYLITGRAWVDFLSDNEHLDERTRAKLEFSTQQIVDALSPTNFAVTNPEVLRLTAETGGKNLLDGLRNMLEDLEASGGKLRPRMVEPEAFVVGRDVATTPGKVVYQNEMMQLIQYAPVTEQVYKRPLLLMPPWMNKFYVLDLRPGNSMIEWLVAQGFTVFVISWVNPDQSMADRGFEDYMLQGPIAALDAVEQATGVREVNVVGYCLGGILLAAAVAWLSARGDDRIKSATYLTTMVDFGDPGEIRLFIDEQGLDRLEKGICRAGMLDGKSVADTWSAMRANDLVWSFFVNSYLLGKSPKPFDILFWNSDSTNMPAAMHTFFMRNMYLENRLREPGGITLAGTPIDVTAVTTPAYVLSTSEDHIAPWKTTYATTQLFKGPTRFVLGASGHIAGVINPPHRKKYGYWTNDDNPADPQAWFDAATEHEGSWWPNWLQWVKRHAGAKVAARDPQAGGLAVIEDAPGSYVMVRR